MNNKSDVMTTEELVYKYLPGTAEYEENKEKVLEEEGTLKKYKKSNIMTVKYSNHDNNVYGIDAKDYVGPAKKKMLDNIFNIQRVGFEKRAVVEYNPHYVHVVGGCLIESPNYIAVQHSKTGRQNGKYTMIQGHVDYSKEYCEYVDVVREKRNESSNFVKFIRYNTIRELPGEVAIVGGTDEDLTSNVGEEVMYLVNKNETLSDREHILLVWSCEISDTDIVKMTTTQDHKHDVVIIPKAELFNDEHVEKYDSWLKDILDLRQ